MAAPFAPPATKSAGSTGVTVTLQPPSIAAAAGALEPTSGAMAAAMSGEAATVKVPPGKAQPFWLLDVALPDVAPAESEPADLSCQPMSQRRIGCRLRRTQRIRWLPRSSCRHW